MNVEAYIELREGRGATARPAQGGSWMVSCPSHEDGRPSLHVSAGDDGRVLLRCFAGCEVAEILRADGLAAADLFERRNGNGRVEVASYDYVDESGELLFQAVRFAPKDFRQRQPDGHGGWIWNLRGVRRILFRLPQVVEAVAAAQTVWIAEGEKDVLALERAGVVGTCNPMGAGKWAPAFSEVLRGAAVVIVADRDEKGREHARQVAASLRDVGAAVRVVEAATGKDAADHLAAGRTLPELVEVDLDASAPAEPPQGPPFVIASEFVALQRELIDPFVSTRDGRTTMLARGRSLLIAGPSDASKSLAMLDLLAKLAAADESDWLGFKVCGGQRVGLIVYPGEGSDEDLAERVGQLVSAGAYLYIWDHWRQGPAPVDDDQGLRRLADEVKRERLDVLAFDTLTSFFRGAHDVSRGIPEQAHDSIAALRDLSAQPLALVGTQHTRKRDTRAATLDELEEISGTYVRKVDAAVVLRKDGESKRRRRVTFAKTRVGPKPDPVIAALPEDEDAPPRLEVVAAVGGDVKQGTEAERIAARVRGESEPITTAVLLAGFDISEDTLRRRRGELEQLGVTYGPAPWLGRNTRAYGTVEQWKAKLGARFGLDDEETR